MTVVVATFGGEIAQPAERIAGEIQRARFLGGARREDQGNAVLVAPILDGGEEDEAIHQPQQLLEQPGGR